MDRIAIISEKVFVYWTPVIIALAVITALCIYASSYLLKGGKVTALFVSLPLCLVLGMVLGRMMHWYCRPGVYNSFADAMTDYSQGDFALVGAFAGCIITAGLLRLIRLSDNLPKMLDAMAVGACVAIPIGRLAPLFNSAGRGMMMPEGMGLPMAYPLINAVTGVPESRLATFMLQCIITAVIAVLLLAYVAVCRFRKKKIKDGDTFLIFLTAYCCSQILCDSMRNDALVLRSNGFVSMVQIVGAIGFAFCLVLFSIRSVKAKGLKYYHFLLWVGIAGMLGLAGGMEYFVQNNGHRALLAYSVMGSALLVTVLCTLTMRFLGKAKAVEPVAEEAVENT